MMCRDVLTQLNEIIPEIVNMQYAGAMVKDTVKTLMNMSDDSLLGLKEMDGKNQVTLKFYTLLVSNASHLPSLLIFVSSYVKIVPFLLL